MNANNFERKKKTQNLDNDLSEYGYRKYYKSHIEGNEFVKQRKKQNQNSNNFQPQKHYEQEQNVERIATTTVIEGSLQPRIRKSKLPTNKEVQEIQNLQQKQEEVQKVEEQIQEIKEHQFNQDEIIENIMDDNSILSELLEFNGESEGVGLKFAYSQSVKQIQLYKFTMRIECPTCLKTFKSETLLYKKTKAPAIKQIHCDSLIGIYFIQNHNQKIKDLQQNSLSIGFLDFSNSKFAIVEAILIIICNCSNRMPVHLCLDVYDKDKQIITCSDSYRSLCKMCCKELILQNPQLPLQIMKDQNKKN